MTTTELEPTTAQLQQPIQFSYEDDDNGFVAATIPLTWKFDEDTIGYIAEHRYSNPHLVIIVASTSEHDYEMFDREAAEKAFEENADLSKDDYDALVKVFTQTVTEYSVTSMQVIPLLNNAGQPSTSKAFVSFDQPGDNVIVGRIVCAENAQAMSFIRRWPRASHDVEIHAKHAPEDALIVDAYNGSRVMMHGIGTSFVNVQVPREMFAKEPSAAAKSLVRQFFRGREDDQCHFRKRVIASTVLSIPVQLYGLFARAAVLLFALVFASRGMANKSLFALNPHDYARTLGSSRWLKDNRGDEYSPARQLLSPIGLAAAAVCFAVIMLPGGVWRMIDTEKTFTFVQLLVIGLGFWAATIGLTMVCWVAFSRKGHRWFGMRIGEPVEDLVERLFPSLEKGTPKVTHEEIDETVARLHAMQASTVAPSQIANTTFKLKFSDLKMKVCKPFAKPTGYNR